MSDSPGIKGFFQALMTDQLISRVVEATVGVLVAGPVGAVAVPLLSKAVEYYGPTVASRVWGWIKEQPPLQACATLEAVANLDARATRSIINEVVEQTAPNASPEAKNLARSYLASIPATLRQTLPRTTSGKTTCPAALLPRDEQDVFRLLPTFLPPYNAPCSLPGTGYELHELLGTGGFGAVYKATAQFEHEPRALKFCLDPERAFTLKREKERLDRFMQQTRAGGSGWPENVVRLLGHNLDHETPFLIFEFVPDGDLNIHVQTLRVKNTRAMQPDEVLALMRQLALAVSHVHAAGLTHRDLKPSNILFAGRTIKIADFGLGAVVPRQNRTVSRQRSSAETTQELRGAGSLLYMSREQKRGAAAHPTQDVYSLGVIWYQLLLDDFSAELGPFWERPLSERAIPANHTELIKQCLDDRPGERPQSATALVEKIDRILQRIDEQERAAREAVSRQQRAQEEVERQRLANEQAERAAELQRVELARRQRQEERARRWNAFRDEWGQSVGVGALTVGAFLLVGMLLGFGAGYQWFHDVLLFKPEAATKQEALIAVLETFIRTLCTHPVQRAVCEAALVYVCVMGVFWAITLFAVAMAATDKREQVGCGVLALVLVAPLICAFVYPLLLYLLTWPATLMVDRLSGPGQGMFVVGLSFALWGTLVGLIVCVIHKTQR